jgi:hypothetical protein
MNNPLKTIRLRLLKKLTIFGKLLTDEYIITVGKKLKNSSEYTIVIQDSNHITVATITPFSDDLPAYENSTIPINLSSGNYTANLWTTKSHVFYSPPFTIS